MQTKGKAILESLKTANVKKEVYGQLKDYLSPLLSSGSLNEATLNYYGHFVISVLRATVSNVRSSGARPELVSIIDLGYSYYRQLQKHIKLSDPCFIPKAFYVVLMNITKTVDYVDDALKFSGYLYNELIELKSQNEDIDMFTNPAILWNLAGKLERENKFDDFNLTLRIRHMALKLLTLKAKNISILVTRLGSTLLRYRQQRSVSGINCTNKTNLESAEIWDSVLKTILPMLWTENHPNEFLFDVLELHIHHARFISFYGTCYSNSIHNFQKTRTFLEHYREKSDKFTESLTLLCDAILSVGEHSKTNLKAVNFTFDCIEDVNSLIECSVKDGSLNPIQIYLISDAYGIFVESLSQWEPLKNGQLKKCVLQKLVKLLELNIGVLHMWPCPSQEDPTVANNGDRVGRWDIYMRTTYTIYMEVLYSLSETDGSNKWLVEAATVSKNYLSDIQNLTQSTTKTIEKHINYIGQWLKKFGRFCYNQCYNEAGVAFYRLLIQQMDSDNKQEEQAEQNYIKAHVYLAELQKRCSDWDSSLKTVLSCLSLKSTAAMLAAVKIWTRIKKDASKHLPYLTNQTLKSFVEENTSFKHGADIDTIALLQMEWHALQISSAYRKRQKDYAVAMLRELVDSTSDPFTKSLYQYELSQILWLTPQTNTKCGKDYLLEAIQSLEPLRQSASTKVKLLIGQAYLLLYTFEQEESNQKGVISDSDPNVVSQQQQNNIPHLTLKMEFAAMEKLDLSLQMFEEAVVDFKEYSALATVETTALLQAILLIASIYTAAIRPLDAARALTVAVQIARYSTNVSCELQCKVFSQAGSTLSSLGCADIAMSLLNTKLTPSASTAILPETNSSTSETMSSLVKTLTKAELFNENGQFSESLILTQQILSHEIFQSNKSKMSCATQGLAKRLLSRLKLQPAMSDIYTEGEGDDNDTPLELAYEAVRMYTAVVQCLVQPDFINSSSISASTTDPGGGGGGTLDLLEKWEIVSQLLESLLHLSRLYCHVGEEREAKCYIKEGLRLSYSLALPRWSATFYLQLACINLLSGKTEDVVKATQEAKAIILSHEKPINMKIVPDDSVVMTYLNEDANNTCTPELQKLEETTYNRYRWSAECSDEENVMKADIFHYTDGFTPLKVGSTAKASCEPCVDITSLDNKDHPDHCTCQHCSDIASLELYLKCLVTSGELEQAIGSRDLSEDILSVAEDQYAWLSQSIKVNLEHTFTEKLSCLLDDRQLGTNQWLTPGRSIYLRNCTFNLVRSYLLRAQMAEKNGQFQLCFEHAKKGLSLFSSSSPNSSNSEVLYLRAGLTLCLANVVQYIPDYFGVAEMVQPIFSLNEISSKFSEISLKSEAVLSVSSDCQTTRYNIEQCIQGIGAIALGEETVDRMNGSKSKNSSSRTRGEVVKSKGKERGSANISTNKESQNLVQNDSNGISPGNCQTSTSDLVECADLCLLDNTSDNKSVEKIKSSVPNRRTKVITKASGKEVRNVRTSKRSTNLNKTAALATASTVDVEIETGRECLFEEGTDVLCKIFKDGEIPGNKPYRINENDTRHPEERSLQSSCLPKCEDEILCDVGSVEPVLSASSEPCAIVVDSVEPVLEGSIEPNNTQDLSLLLVNNCSKTTKMTVKSRGRRKVSNNNESCVFGGKVVSGLLQLGILEDTSSESIVETLAESVGTKLKESTKNSKTIAKSRVKRGVSNRKGAVSINNESWSEAEQQQHIEQSMAKKTRGRKPKSCTMKSPESISVATVNTEGVTKLSKITKKIVPIVNVSKSEDNRTQNIFDFDEMDKCKVLGKKTSRIKSRQLKEKRADWHTRIAQASNIIGREHRRGEVTTPEKVFSLSPMDLSVSPTVPSTPGSCFRLNDSWQSVSPLSELGSPSSTPRTNPTRYLSFCDSKNSCDSNLFVSKSLLNLSVSSPELPRAAEDTDISSPVLNTKRNRGRRKIIAKSSLNSKDLSGNLDSTNKNEDREQLRKIALEAAYQQMCCFPPCSLHSSTCKALATMYLTHNPTLAAFYLHEAQAVTLRHSLITQLNKKIRKLRKDQKNNENNKTSHPCLSSRNAPCIENLRRAKRALGFGRQTDVLSSLIEVIHPDLTVCQVSVIRPAGSLPYLVVTQYRNGSTPTVISVLGLGSMQGSELFQVYKSIQLGNQSSLSLVNKTDWWNTRHKLNNKMEDVVDQIERHWLGHWKGVLLGHLTNQEDRDKLKRLAQEVQEVIHRECKTSPSLGQLQILIDSGELLSDKYLESALTEVTGLTDVSDSTFQSIKSLILRQFKTLNSCVSDRHPVTLILDKEIQHLPWENLPILQNHPVTRMPSLYYLKVQKCFLHNQNSILTDGVDRQNTYYVLNPDDNLPCTQEIFKDWFQSISGWEGVVGKPPTADQFITALTQKDTMIYCGHGNGNKYLNGDSLQQLNCRAAAILMGCSSGHMEAKGVLDESGMINNYYLAFCPVIVANLWDVTDKDIDRFLQALLKNWMPTSNSGDTSNKDGMSLTKAVVKARDACKLSYLIGCAPVVYGFPL